MLKKSELNFESFKGVSPLVELWKETRGRESDVFKITNQEQKQKSQLLSSLFASLNNQNVESPLLNLYANQKSFCAFCTLI